MLPKKNRLKRKKDFQQVFKKGKGFQEGLLFFKMRANDLKESRFGFLVSKKVSKRAVMRNKLKRRLREAVREKLPAIKKGIDGVFIARSGLEKKDFSEIERIVEKLLTKARVLETKSKN